MAYLSINEQDKVLYACSCFLLSSLGELYFCRRCKAPRCQECVASAVDNLSCPHCVDNAPVMEAKKKNRCGRCFQCPQCSNTLSLRTVMVSNEGAGDQAKPQSSDATSSSDREVSKNMIGSRSPGGTKLYYLACSYCRWSTREVDIKDKRSPLDFKERVSAHQKQIDDLILYYKDFANKDKELMEREHVKKPLRRVKSFTSTLDTTKYSASKLQESEGVVNIRRAGSISVNSLALDKVAAVPTVPEPLPDDMYTASVNLMNITSLEQRLLDPTYQPTFCSELWPRLVNLIGKKLHRCKGCEHILIKAEFSPTSIRFKMHQIAWHAIPQVRIAQLPQIGMPSVVIVSLSNPTNYAMDISFSECPTDMLVRLKEKPVKVELPAGNFILTPSDDVGEALESTEDADSKPISSYIHSKAAGKLYLKFKIDAEGTDEYVSIICMLKFSYKSPVEPFERCDIEIPVVIRIGKLG